MKTPEPQPPTRIPDEATLRAALEGPRFLLFKHSPICPISDRARRRYERFVTDHPDLPTAWVDVIEQRELARGIVAEHGIRHESPQALLFSEGRCTWHASHDGIQEASLGDALAALA